MTRACETLSSAAIASPGIFRAMALTPPALRGHRRRSKASQSSSRQASTSGPSPVDAGASSRVAGILVGNDSRPWSLPSSARRRVAVAVSAGLSSPARLALRGRFYFRKFMARGVWPSAHATGGERPRHWNEPPVTASNETVSIPVPAAQEPKFYSLETKSGE